VGALAVSGRLGREPVEQEHQGGDAERDHDAEGKNAQEQLRGAASYLWLHAVQCAKGTNGTLRAARALGTEEKGADMKALAKRIGVEILGWTLVLLGIAALVLPGPGLILLALGLVVLATQYEWAERRLEPVKERAIKTASDGVETWPRIIMSTLGALGITAVGVVWGLSPAAPGWWPLADKWWLPGGWGTGSSLIVSGLIALALVVYSYREYRPEKAAS
jgi:hypothetical protein